jgi:hypothetical protein
VTTPLGSATLGPVKQFKLLLILGGVLLLGGCDRDDGIRTYNAPKDPPPGAAPAPVVEAGENHWTVPPTWKMLPPGPMIKAAYAVSENPPIKMTVSQVMAMESGAATVLANVNRWEGQLGAAKTSEAEMGKLVIPIPLEGREGLMVDLKGPATGGKRQPGMLAAMIPDNDVVWVFKMTGGADDLAAQKATFEGVVKSFHLDGEAHPKTTSANPPHTAPPSPGEGQAGAIPGIASFTLPEGWRVDPQPHAMRAGTIIVPGGSGNERGEIVVSQLSSTSLADLMFNLNRWRGQVHLAAAKDAIVNPPQSVAFQQGPGVIRDFEGPESDGAGRLRQLVAYTQFPQASQIWFFRLVGPYDLVTQSKPQFEAFVKSLKFDEK